MKNIKHTFWLGMMLFGLSACGGGSSSSDTNAGSNIVSGLASCASPNSTQAVVCGSALATDGVTPLVNAEVSLVSGGKLASVSGAASRGVANPDKCLTDIAGDFVCLLPTGVSGAVTLKVSLAGFDDSTFIANVSPGAVTETGGQALVSNTSNRWVVVPGSFDGVQVLLAQLKGCVLNDAVGNPFNAVTGSPENARGSADCENKGLLVLDDNPASVNYAPDFLVSSGLDSYDSLFVNCDADFGSVVPNTALQSFVNSGKHIYFSDLSDSWLTEAFPNKVVVAGHETSTGTLTSVVKSSGLQTVVGSNMDVEFDLPVWTALDSVSSGVTTFIEGDITALSNYPGTHPITVGWRNNSSSGCVFYTSYHIEGASQGAPQERAIKYLVQNISSVCQ